MDRKTAKDKAKDLATGLGITLYVIPDNGGYKISQTNPESGEVIVCPPGKSSDMASHGHGLGDNYRRDGETKNPAR
jgi:hypothetical protein